jgi:malonate-semialdehyde dehydrogenase (acetylating)/methylmalonate-semialdehyde dehydrogenase
VVTQINHFIDGKQIPGGAERRLAAFNPATGEQTGSVVAANAADVANAVAAQVRPAGFRRN